MGNFFLVPINFFAVLICSVSNMVVGFLWYGPLFGKNWEKLVGFTPEKLAKAKERMKKTYFAMFVSSFITAYTLFHFIWYAASGSVTLFISVKTALWAWIGFVMPISLTKHLFSPDKKPVSILFIETGYHLISLIMMGMIFNFIKQF